MEKVVKLTIALYAKNLPLWLMLKDLAEQIGWLNKILRFFLGSFKIFKSINLISLYFKLKKSHQK